MGGQGFNSVTGKIIRVLKELRNEVTAFGLQMAIPLHGLSDQLMVSFLMGDISIVSLISTFVLIKLTLQ